MDLPKIKLPTSPTTLVITITLLCVVGLGAWTSYTYFFQSAPEVSTTIKAQQYYNNELKTITAELEKFKTYQIDTSNPIDTGKTDPFKPF